MPPTPTHPFAKPDGSLLSEINTGRSYLKTYDDLIKDPTKDMLLPCVLAIDKTHCDSSSRLQMEPLTILLAYLSMTSEKNPPQFEFLD